MTRAVVSVPNQDVCSLPEGHAVLLWPTSLSELSRASLGDLEYWLQGVLRKVRQTKSVPPEADQPDANDAATATD